jgi:hypothetical protein
MLLPVPPKLRKRPLKWDHSPSAAPPLPTVTVVSVSADGAGNGVILFDSAGVAISAVDSVSQLEIDAGEGVWIACDAVLDFAANAITLQCGLAIEAGMGWRVLSPMGVTWNDNPAIVMTVPASGVVL